MDGTDVTDESSVSSTPMTDAFEGQFPYYILFGMTTEEYWEGDPRLVISFRKANELKNEELDSQLWLQGLYNYIALTTVISRAFDKHSTAEYPKESMSSSGKKKEKSEEQGIDSIVKKLTMFALDWNTKNIEEVTDGRDNG